MNRNIFILTAALLILAASASAAINDPTLYFNFSQTSGNLQNYTNGGAASYTVGSGITQTGSGIVGNAYDFTNTNGGIDLGTSSFLNIDGARPTTWIFFAKYDAMGGATIMHKTSASAAQSEGLAILNLNNNVRVAVPWLDLNSNYSTGTTAFQCLAVTYDGGAGGSYETRFYTNGTFHSSRNINGPIGNTSGRSLMIGTNNPNVGGTKFDGLLDELAIYNRELDASDIAQICGNWSAGVNYLAGGTPPAGPVPTLTIRVSDIVTGSNVAGFCISATGTNTTQNLCNSTGTSISFNTTGTYNITAHTINGSTYLNASVQNYLFSADQTLTVNTTQGYLDVTASRLFTNTSISAFNASNNRSANTTTNGSLLLPASVGSQNVTINVTGNFSKTITCTLAAALQTASCGATGIHDNYFAFNVTDIWNNAAVTNFTISVQNPTLGGQLYNTSTTSGLVNVSLLQGYTYLVELSTPAGAYEYLNVTLAANATSQKYEFDVFPAPSIDITIVSAEDNTLITENVSIQLINNATGQRNYTITGGFFSDRITPGLYTVKLESGNFSQSTYTVTVSEGRVYYLTAYLQFAPNTLILQFVDSIRTNTVVPGATVSQSRIVNGSRVVVNAKTSDITGRTSFRYATDTKYWFSITAPGYEDKLFELDPVLFSTYQVKLTKTTSMDVEQDYTGVLIQYEPRIFQNERENQFNITFSSPSGTLATYRYNVTYPGGSVAGSGSNVAGQTFSDPFNISGATITDRVIIFIEYDTSIGGPKNYTFQHSIVISPSNTTWMGREDKTYGMGLLERLLIGVVIVLVAAGIATLAAGPVAGLAVGLLVMGFFVKADFWPWWAAGLSFLAGFALIVGRSD